MSLADIDNGTAMKGRRLAPVAIPALGKVLHWISATLILGMFVSGIVMTQLGSGRVADALYASHKLAGACALALLAVRLIYRIQARVMRRWPSQKGGRPIHLALYAVAIVTPVLGWAGISDFGARETIFGIRLPSIWPEGLGYDGWLFKAHAYAAFALVALVVLHVAVALQEFIMRGEAGMAKHHSGFEALESDRASASFHSSVPEADTRVRVG